VKLALPRLNDAQPVAPSGTFGFVKLLRLQKKATFGGYPFHLE
jgi:hypothetical protein